MFWAEHVRDVSGMSGHLWPETALRTTGLMLGQYYLMLGQYYLMLGQLCLMRGQCSKILGQYCLMLGHYCLMLGQYCLMLGNYCTANWQTVACCKATNSVVQIKSSLCSL